MSKPKLKNTLGTAPSLRSAASICGISLRAVQAAKNAGCKAVGPSGRVNCDQLVTWLGDHPEALAIAGQALSRDEEIILKIRAERRLKEHLLGVKKEEFVSGRQVEQDVFDMIQAAKAVLLSGPASLAPQVVGSSIPEAELILRKWLHQALTQLHQDPLGRRTEKPLAGT